MFGRDVDQTAELLHVAIDGRACKAALKAAYSDRRISAKRRGGRESRRLRAPAQKPQGFQQVSATARTSFPGTWRLEQTSKAVVNVGEMCTTCASDLIGWPHGIPEFRRLRIEAPQANLI